MQSLEEVDFQSSSESADAGGHEVVQQVRPEPTKKKGPKPPKGSLNLHGFDIEQFLLYPRQYKEGAVPAVILKDDLIDDLTRIKTEYGKRIADEFAERKLLPTQEQVQAVYEYYCSTFSATPFTNLHIFVKKNVFVIRHQALPMAQLKALCCTIPIIAGLKHVILQNNNLGDEFGAAVLFACFMHPQVTQISIIGNFMRASFANTAYTLFHTFPNKIVDLNISGSLNYPDHMDQLTVDMQELKALQKLNISGIALASQACANIRTFLLRSDQLKALDMSRCKIQFQGTRSIFQGVNRNFGL